MTASARAQQQREKREREKKPRGFFIQLHLVRRRRRKKLILSPLLSFFSSSSFSFSSFPTQIHAKKAGGEAGEALKSKPIKAKSAGKGGAGEALAAGEAGGKVKAPKVSIY